MMPTAKANRIDWDAPEMTALIRAAIGEDVGSCDLTTSALVPAGRLARARIVAKQDLVVAGLPVAERVFRALDSDILFQAQYEDGAQVPAGAAVAAIEGRAQAILSGERTALNFLAHLSGISTLTRQFVNAMTGTRARIRDTRKTLPGLRALEKWAVRVGGGTNHRFGLFDAILIKENHIAIAGSVAEALRRAKTFAVAMQPTPLEMAERESFRAFENQGFLPIQVEVRNQAELQEALAAGAELLLLDNVSPTDAARLVAIARRERADCVVEVSGRVTLATARAYADAGVDFISVGALTHSAPAADLSLLVEPTSGG